MQMQHSHTYVKKVKSKNKNKQKSKPKAFCLVEMQKMVRFFFKNHFIVGLKITSRLYLYHVIWTAPVVVTSCHIVHMCRGSGCDHKEVVLCPGPVCPPPQWNIKATSQPIVIHAEQSEKEERHYLKGTGSKARHRRNKSLLRTTGPCLSSPKQMSCKCSLKRIKVRTSWWLTHMECFVVVRL